jgi:phenylalanyl-tRNA synthetase alpha chain
MADELAANVLKYLSENEPIDTQDLAKMLCVDHQKIVGVVKSLQASGDVR